MCEDVETNKKWIPIIFSNNNILFILRSLLDQFYFRGIFTRVLMKLKLQEHSLVWALIRHYNGLELTCAY